MHIQNLVKILSMFSQDIERKGNCYRRNDSNRHTDGQPKSSIAPLFQSRAIIKAAYSVTLLFSFSIICKSRIKLCFHNKNVQYS